MKRLLVFSFICFLFSCGKQKKVYFTLEPSEAPTIFDNSVRVYSVTARFGENGQPGFPPDITLEFPSNEGIECGGYERYTNSTATSETFTFEKGDDIRIHLEVRACKHFGGGVTGDTETSQFLQSNIGWYNLKAHIGRREYLIYENYQPYIIANDRSCYKNDVNYWEVP